MLITLERICCSDPPVSNSSVKTDGSLRLPAPMTIRQALAFPKASDSFSAEDINDALVKVRCCCWTCGLKHSVVGTSQFVQSISTGLTVPRVEVDTMGWGGIRVGLEMRWVCTDELICLALLHDIMLKKHMVDGLEKVRLPELLLLGIDEQLDVAWQQKQILFLFQMLLPRTWIWTYVQCALHISHYMSWVSNTIDALLTFSISLWVGELSRWMVHFQEVNFRSWWLFGS